jgi:hypothetical protein
VFRLTFTWQNQQVYTCGEIIKLGKERYNDMEKQDMEGKMSENS